MSPVVLQAALVTVFVESNEGYLPAPPPQPIQPRPAGTAKEATCPPPAMPNGGGVQMHRAAGGGRRKEKPHDALTSRGGASQQQQL